MRIGFAIFALGLFFTQTGQIAAADLPAAMDVPVPPQEERGIWAAIAYSEADQKHGFFWGADKRQEAMDTALNHCRNAGGNECKVAEVFRNHRHWDDDDNTGFPYNHCGALAVAKERAGQIFPWAAKSARTRKDAEDRALNACQGAGGTKCRVREWVCT
ncbi:DUF4189 domain-containing protein [Brucella pseudintermedia]|uniref:DUF4189 domain-containing protein n=1 Tax=Brucella pseudintermedia TaxID=370111 RepID=UPI00124D7A5D|nr:DUF4189 domain-containing protein [Brucella pseudintermedia]KAB2680993.1 DUF4189 domain-containing protein [Brucella pseudintermedia]